MSRAKQNQLRTAPPSHTGVGAVRINCASHAKLNQLRSRIEGLVCRDCGRFFADAVPVPSIFARIEELIAYHSTLPAEELSIETKLANLKKRYREAPAACRGCGKPLERPLGSPP